MPASKMNKKTLGLRLDIPQNSAKLSPPSSVLPPRSPSPKRGPSSTYLLQPGLVPPPHSPPPKPDTQESAWWCGHEWVLPIRAQPKVTVAPARVVACSNKQLDAVKYGGIREYDELRLMKQVLEKRARQQQVENRSF